MQSPCYSTVVECPPSTAHICMRIHPECKSYSDLGSRACYQRPSYSAIMGVFGGCNSGGCFLGALLGGRGLHSSTFQLNLSRF
jgi:hypothetical protein